MEALLATDEANGARDLVGTAVVALEAAGVGFGFLLGAILVYAVGSFALMRPHAVARRWGVSLREIFREVFLATATQPLLPLYYLVGRRMGGRAAGGVPVVLVHGYMQNRVGFVGLARALARRGKGPLFGINYPWWGSIPNNARRLERFVAEVCAETGAPGVDLVCHSMGGLVAMEMLRDEAKRATLKVRKCVTIATPHAGVAWRGPLLGIGAGNLRRGSKLLETYAGMTLTIPTLSIYSSHDNIVHPKATSSLVARGGRDYEVEGLGHLSILFSPVVAEHVAAFLDEATAPTVVPASPEAIVRAAPPAVRVGSTEERAAANRLVDTIADSDVGARPAPVGHGDDDDALDNASAARGSAV